MKTTKIQARISEELKSDVEIVFSELGLTMSEAITLFLSQVKFTKGLPFSVSLPSKSKRLKTNADEIIGKCQKVSKKWIGKFDAAKDIRELRDSRI